MIYLTEVVALNLFSGKASGISILWKYCKNLPRKFISAYISSSQFYYLHFMQNGA